MSRTLQVGASGQDPFDLDSDSGRPLQHSFARVAFVLASETRERDRARDRPEAGVSPGHLAGASGIVQRVAYSFGTDWDYGAYNILQGLDLSGVANAKRALNEGLEGLEAQVTKLLQHNYYQKLTSFTTEEKEQAFLVLKSEIGALQGFVEKEDKSTVKWANRTSKGAELVQKTKSATTLLGKFKTYLEDAQKQSSEEAELIEAISAGLNKLGALNGQLSGFLSQEAKNERSAAKEKQRELEKQKGLVGLSEIRALGEKVAPIEEAYVTAENERSVALKEKEKQTQLEQAKEEARQKRESEKREKREAFEKGVKTKAGNSFSELLSACGQNYALLDEVLGKASSGSPGQLVNALTFVDVTQKISRETFYSLLQKVSLPALAKLLRAIGKGKGADLLNILTTKRKGSEATVQELIENTNDMDYAGLDSLLGDVGGDANTALALLNKPGKPADVRGVLAHEEVGSDSGKAEELLENEGTASDTRALLTAGVGFDDAKELLKLKCVKGKGAEVAFVFHAAADDLDKTKLVFKHAKYPATVKEWIENGHTFDTIHDKLKAYNGQRFWNGTMTTEPSVTGAADVADLISRAVNLTSAGTGDFWYKHHGNYAGKDTMALPDRDSSSYREYGFEQLGVDTSKRGVKRIVEDGVGNRYYSVSHYTSFSRIT